jgi:RNA polymerase sigma-70 factor (ECF subfamily)
LGTFDSFGCLKQEKKVNSEYINIDDAVLVNKCQKGDSAAVERLIIKYQNRIYNLILRMCGNPEDAAELTQDTFIKVIEKIASFEGKSSFYTWLFRIAVNITLNFCQKNARLAAKSLEEQTLDNILQDNNTPEPSVIAQNKELCQLVTCSLEKLDEAQRAVIVLRDIEGMNYEQISEVLGLELGTVKSRISRARTELKYILESMI